MSVIKNKNLTYLRGMLSQISNAEQFSIIKEKVKKDAFATYLMGLGSD